MGAGQVGGVVVDYVKDGQLMWFGLDVVGYCSI